jgi:putative membrane protein
MNTDTMQQTNERKWYVLIGVISVVVVGVVALLLFAAQDATAGSPEIYILPKLNALINSTVSILLIAGLYFILNKQIKAHKSCMIAAFTLSALFLVSYIIYHYNAPHTSFEGEGLIRQFYFFILISHIILAIFIVPLVLITLFRAWREDFEKHKRIARWTFPIWLYVSITGVAVYLMISPYYPV